MKEDVLHQLGERVKTLRKSHNMTQEELAVRSGISLKYIQRVEGKAPSNIGLEYLDKLSKGFDLPFGNCLNSNSKLDSSYVRKTI